MAENSTVVMASTSHPLISATASASHYQPSSSIDKSSDEERRDDEEEEEGEGGGGTSRKARPSPLDIGTGQRSAAGGPITPTALRPVHRSSTRNEKERKIGHRRVDEEGQITYKKIQTSQIMGAIQLGISHSIGGLASKPERDVLMQDFAVVETTIFPSQGSNLTPAHHFIDFRFKTYAPVAFRYFRDLFGIQPEDFLLSISNEPMRELTNPGASGSIFYVTADDEFIVKTVQHKEGEFLQKLLPGYYMNLNQNPRTLLPKFFGLYCYQYGGKNVRLAVMNNLLPSDIKIHQKYDLKGSTYKRRAAKHERSKASPTFKDLDFMEHHTEGLFLEAETYNALVKTISRDCRVLASFKIMDYSLLVGIHNRDKALKERMEQKQSRAQLDHNDGAGSSDMDGVGIPNSASLTGSLSRSRSIYKQKLVAHSTAMEAIQAESEPVDEEDDVPPGGIPARNAKGERLFLFLGIIDILQSYRFKKKLEHTWKSMLHDGDTVSVHRPEFYAERFQNFMAQHVFKKVPSLDLPEIKGIHRKFRTLVSSYIALKHSPSRKKSLSRHRPPSGSEEGKLDEHDGHQGFPPIYNRNGISRRPISASSATAVGVSIPHSVSPYTSSAFVVQSGSSSITSPTITNADPGPSLTSVVTVVAKSSSSQQVTLPSTTTTTTDHQPTAATTITYTSNMSYTGAKMTQIQFGSVRATKVPPPVPPRSPRKTYNPNPVPSLSHMDIPVSLTPPPTFEEATVDEPQAKSKARSSTDPNPPTSDSHTNIVTNNNQGHQRNSSTGTNQTEATSISRVGGMHIECLQSEGSGSLSSGSVARMWTPPHSVEGSTPTHTEGTPSFTESSSSGDLGCPTTPVRQASGGRTVMSNVIGASTNSVNSVSTIGSGGPRLYQETEM